MNRRLFPPLSLLALALVPLTALDPASAGALAADPLEEVDRFLGPHPWETEFAEPVQMNGRYDECIGTSTCDGYDVKTRTAMVEHATVEITTEIGASGEPKTSKLSQSDWDRTGGNLIRHDLGVMESYGYRWAIKNTETVEVRLIVNGQDQVQRVLSVTITAENGAGGAIEVEYRISNTLPGLGQLVFRRETHSGPFPLERVRSLTSIEFNS